MVDGAVRNRKLLGDPWIDRACVSHHHTRFVDLLFDDRAECFRVDGSNVKGANLAFALNE
jgi:hypothetical protein